MNFLRNKVCEFYMFKRIKEFIKVKRFKINNRFLSS